MRRSSETVSQATMRPVLFIFVIIDKSKPTKKALASSDLSFFHEDATVIALKNSKTINPVM